MMMMVMEEEGEEEEDLPPWVAVDGGVLLQGELQGGGVAGEKVSHLEQVRPVTFKPEYMVSRTRTKEEPQFSKKCVFDKLYIVIGLISFVYIYII